MLKLKLTGELDHHNAEKIRKKLDKEIISSLSSKNHEWFHKRLKNRALSWLSLSLVSSFIYSLSEFF